ncbi:hotdog fold thioesterase [Rhodococcus sp. NPDC003318]|uniref:PaaI family thioesterase n=1 Tax=Rhodococcus sp. NPDC003318 TaxID=3364503 RepID=UPI0036780FAF
MSVTTELRWTPQTLFRVSPPARIGDANQTVMTIDSGTPPGTAALGVLLDDLLGFTLYDRRGDRAGLVTAELSVDVVRPAAWQGPHLTAESRLEALDRDGGLSSARVQDSAGALVAIATLRGNFVDDVSPQRTVVTAPGPDPQPLVGGLAGSPIDLLGGVLEATGSGVRLTVPGQEQLANANGVMHGGVITCAHDLAGTAAAAAGDIPMRAGSLRVNFFRAVPVDGPVVFDAETVRAGRRVAVTRVTARDHLGRTCSVATVTCRRDPAC